MADLVIYGIPAEEWPVAFANVAGRAGFVIEVDNSQLTSGLRKAEREVVASTSKMSASAEQMSPRRSAREVQHADRSPSGFALPPSEF